MLLGVVLELSAVILPVEEEDITAETDESEVSPTTQLGEVALPIVSVPLFDSNFL